MIKNEKEHTDRPWKYDVRSEKGHPGVSGMTMARMPSRGKATTHKNENKNEAPPHDAGQG